MKQVNLHNFKEVLGQERPYLLYFRSTWCFSCGAEGCIMQELEPHYDNIDFYTIDADTESELNTLFGIKQLPASVVMHKGKVLEHHSGFMPKARVEEILRKIERTN